MKCSAWRHGPKSFFNYSLTLTLLQGAQSCNSLHARDVEVPIILNPVFCRKRLMEILLYGNIHSYKVLNVFWMVKFTEHINAIWHS